MACKYYYADQSFNSRDELVDFLSDKGYLLTPQGQIAEIYTYDSRFLNLADYNKDPLLIKDARSVFADKVDIWMNPTDDVVEEKDEDGFSELVNLPYTRAEAIQFAFEDLKDDLEDLQGIMSEMTAKGETPSKQDSLRLTSLTILTDPKKFGDMVKDFYPMVRITADGDSIKVTDHGAAKDYTLDSDEDVENNLPEATEEQEDNPAEEDGVKVIKGNENWNDNEDTVNPLRKASSAVKELMSNIMVEVGVRPDGSPIRTEVNPGYVFYKLLQNISGIDVTDLQASASTVMNEIEQIRKNFISNGMNPVPTNRDFQIFLRIRNLLATSAETSDANGKPLPIAQYQLQWVGDNQKGHYQLVDKVKKKVTDLPSNHTENLFRQVQRETGLSYDVIGRLYQKAEAAETINSIYNVVNSLRAKSPMFAEYTWQFTSGKRQYLKRVYKPYKNQQHLASIENILVQTLELNFENLDKFEKVLVAGSSSEADAKTAIVGVLNSLGLLPPKTAPLIEDSEAFNLLEDMLGLVRDVGTIGQETGKDEEGNPIIKNDADVRSDSRGRINQIAEYIGRSQVELGRSTSYRGGDGQQRWFHTPGSQAIETIQRIVSNKTPRRYLGLPFYQSNIFNPQSVSQLNTITRFYEHDSIADTNEFYKPISYRGEDALSWYERNFFYGFINHYNSRSGKYIQQFYTISDKPNIIGAEINLLSPVELKKAIKVALLQELNRPEHQNLDQYDITKTFLDYQYDREQAKKDPDSVVEKIYERWTQNAAEEVEKLIDLNPSIDKGFIKAFRDLQDKGFIPSDIPIDEDSELFLRTGSTTLLREEAQKYLRPMYDLYYKNFFINSLFLNQLVAGDQAQYKDAYDQTKRMSIVFATGVKGRVNEETGLRRTFNVAVIDDIQESVKANDPKLAPFQRLIGKKYDKTDAQGFAIPERMDNIRKGFSRESNLGSTIKPVYFGIDDQGIARAVKYSTIEITDELAKAFPELQQLRFEMTFGRSAYATDPRTIELYNKKIREGLKDEELFEYNEIINSIIGSGLQTDELVFKSAFKVGAPKVRGKFNKDTNAFEIPGESVVTLLNTNYRHQLNPRHDADSETANMTQLTYQINTNGKNFGRLARVLRLNALIHTTGMDDVWDRLIGKDGKAKTKRIREELRAKLGKIQGNQRLMDFLDEEGISLDIPFLANKLEQTLIAVASKNTVEIKHKGSKLVLQSAVGTAQSTKVKEIQENMKAAGVFKEPEIVFNKDGSYHMECYIPEATFRQLKGMNKMSDEDFLNFIKNDPVYSTILGFRIPSTELHSAVPLKVIGFYPNQYGDNIIIAPKELVLLHGSDFDIDSLYTVNKYIASENLTSPDGVQIAYAGAAVGYFNTTAGARKLSFLKAGQTFTDFLTEELNKWKDTPAQAKYVRKVKKLIRQAASNEIQETFLETIQDPENIQDMMTPIDLGNFNDIDDPNSVFSELIALRQKDSAYQAIIDVEPKLEDFSSAEDPKKAFKKAHDTWKLSFLRVPRNLNKPGDGVLMHQDNFRAKNLTGAFANAFKIVSYVFMGTNNFTQGNKPEAEQPLPELKEDYHITIDGETFTGFSRYVKQNGKLLDGTNGNPRVTIWQNLDSLINAAIDHVKEQILNIVNATEQTGNAFVAMTAMGIPIDKVSLFMTQPVIKEISNRAREKDPIKSTKSDLLKKIYEALEREDPAFKAEMDAIREDGAMSDEDKLRTIAEKSYAFLDKVETETPASVSTKQMKAAYSKDLADEFTSKDLIDQLGIIRTFEKLDILGRTYLFKGSLALRSVQQLPHEYSRLQDTLDNYGQFFDVESFLNGTDSENSLINSELPFTNVDLSQIPNVQSAIQTVQRTKELLGKVLIRNNPNLLQFAKEINDEAVRYGLGNTVADSDTVPSEETEEKEETVKGFLDHNINKSLQKIVDAFIEFALSGAIYTDASGQVRRMSTLEEPATIVKQRYRRFDSTQGQYVTATREVEVTGTASWVNQFLNLGFELDDKTLMSLKDLKRRYGSRGGNLMLQQILIGQKTGAIMPHIRFAMGTLDDLEKLSYEQAFRDMKKLSIHKNKDGTIAKPEILKAEVYNDLQHNLLKYAVLEQGLAFGSYNYSSLMEIGIFKGLSSAIDNILKDYFERGESAGNNRKPDKIKELFLLQLVMQRVSSLTNLSKMAVKDAEGNLVAGLENNIYYDLKITSKSAEELPKFGKRNKTAYIRIASNEGGTYYRKIETLDSAKSFQYTEAVLAPDYILNQTDRGYKIDDHFVPSYLDLGGNVKASRDADGKIKYTLTLVTKQEPKIPMLTPDTEVHVYNKSNYARVGIDKSGWKVVSTEAVDDNTIVTVTPTTALTAADQDLIRMAVDKGDAEFVECSVITRKSS